MEFVIFGPPGSGKGTYSSRLESKLNVKHIATGDIFREAVDKENELGKKVSEYLEKGKLVPDSLVNKVVKRKLKEINKSDFILDGYPRTVEQAKFLDNFLELDAVIILDVTESIIIERLSSRRICKDCGEVFNKLFLPPEEEGKCDKCGGELYQREDDKPEVIKDRIETYEKRSSPVLNFYEDKVPFVTLKCREADAPVDKMVKEIVNKLENSGIVS